MRSRLLFSAITVSALGLFFLAAPPAESQKGGFGRGSFGAPGGAGPGGGGWSRGGMMPGGGDPARIFEMLSRGRGFFPISETRSLRGQLTEFAAQKRITNGQITRDQFMTFWKSRMTVLRPVTPMAPTGNTKAGATSADTSGKPTASGTDRNEALTAWAESEFKRRDRNDDSYLNSDEVPDALKTDFTKWDKSNDKLISLNEFRTYFQDRFQSGARDDTATTVTRIIEEEDLDTRPTVYRAGNLPKDLPSWYGELDTNKDGQIALHEWRAARKDLDEYRGYDINDDALLTPEEVLRHQASARAASNSGGATTTIIGRGGDERPRFEGKGGYGRFGGGTGGFGRFGGDRSTGQTGDGKAGFRRFDGNKGGFGDKSGPRFQFVRPK